MNDQKLEATSQTFFENMYRNDCDPWRFASSAYELERYTAIMAALDNRRYRSAFEPGCSIGVLTERLASQCELLLATDISPTAVELARERCSHLANVQVVCLPLTEHLSIKDMDLLMLSEVGYYFDRDLWRTVVQNLVKGVVASGTILASHWLGQSDDHLQTGDNIHSALQSLDGLDLEHSERHPGFRLDRWRKR
jgi:SAM-dependent methyltransferase